jgi:hypothetical protein
MASSRWKRFSFFERQSITIPDAVMNDLAIADNLSDVSLSSSFSHIGFIITTAALPLHTKPATITTSTSKAHVTSSDSTTATTIQQQQNSITAMWSSLYACQPEMVGNRSNNAVKDKAVQLPSQGQASYIPSSSSPSTIATTTLMDGLVLSYLTSPLCGCNSSV